jgi:hypothetical protein
MRLADTGDAPFRRRVAGIGVVIAAHQHEIDAIVRRAPLQECRVERGDAPGFRVQKIAEDDEPARVGLAHSRARRARSAAVAPRGSGTPPARNAAALPR